MQYFIYLDKPAVEVVYPDGRCLTHIRPGGGKSKIAADMLSTFHSEQQSGMRKDKPILGNNLGSLDQENN